MVLLPAWAAAAEVIEMSPYEVAAESVEFRGWTKLRSPNFVVYTDARVKEVRPYVQQMEMMHMVAQVVLGRKPLSHEPVRVILPASRSDWRKLRSKGRVKWKVATTGWDEFSPTVLVEYDWQDQGIHVMWGSLGGLEGSLLGIDWAFSVGRGFSHFFETSRIIDGGINVGALNPRVHNIKQLGFLDWDRFFAITPRSDEFRKGGSDLHRFGGQAALFFHYMLMGGDPEGLDKILDWNARLVAGTEPTSEAFAEVFGMDYETFHQDIKRYLDADKFVSYNYDSLQNVLDFVVTEIDVKATEMRELFVLVQIINQRIDESKVALDTLMQRGLETPDLRPFLIEACIAWRRTDDARDVAQIMLSDGDKAANTFGLLGVIDLAEEVGQPELNDQVSEDQFAKIRPYFEAALQREPLSSNYNVYWAWLLAFRQNISSIELEELRAVCRRMEGNGETDDPLAALAVACWRTGDNETARRLVEVLLSSPYTDRGVRKIVTELAAELNKT